jgi:Zn-finger nucleic acid-binding protein
MHKTTRRPRQGPVAPLARAGSFGAMADYRHGALRCPGCGEILEERAIEGAQVDVCPACSGVWIDWMDGDLRAVSERLGRLPRAAAIGKEGTRACPVCDQGLEATTVSPERPDAIVHRCGSCAGAFVPRASQALIVEDEEASPSAEPFLTRLLDRLARWILPG